VHHFSWANTTKENRQMVAMLKELKSHYLRQFPGGRFVVSWFLTAKPRLDSAAQQDFIAQLAKNGIEHWDNADESRAPIDPQQPHRYNIKHDGHPNGLANQLYADFLAEHLAK
jgi:hypothetical protein